MRADLAFGEQILDIADNTADDWLYNEKTGKLTINKEAILRSKLKIRTMRFHMERLHPQQWGDRQQIDLKSDYALMSEAERVAKALELLGLIREITGPPPEPPAIVYRPADDKLEPEPGGIG